MVLLGSEYGGSNFALETLFFRLYVLKRAWKSSLRTLPLATVQIPSHRPLSLSLNNVEFGWFRKHVMQFMKGQNDETLQLFSFLFSSSFGVYSLSETMFQSAV